ncbi:MAG: ABC-F family ATP-binding cassette domain-containing protein [Acidobacteriota bacterium]
MVQIKNIHYSIGERELITGINWIINPGQKSALLGINGSGKTTLLKIINGEIEQDSGKILKPNEYSIGYLPQEIINFKDIKVINEVRSGREDILKLEKELNELRDKLSGTGNKKNSDLEKLDTLETRFNSIEGYDLDRKARKILYGLGFAETDIEKNTTELSGGWQMRVHLAKLLVKEPDLLLLDEPTNHLDIHSIEWLEKFLSGFRGSVIVVSHDRFFVNRVTENIFELERGKINFFNGGFEFYKEQKKLKEEKLIEEMKDVLKKREHLEKFINRFRYKNTKAKQVKSRIKDLNKLEVDRLVSTPDFLKFEIKIGKHSYANVLDVSKISFGYKSSELVFSDISFSISRGQKIALIGENGSGKTTLLKLISGILTPLEGDIFQGERTETGYYGQHQSETLDLNSNIIDVVSNSSEESNITNIRKVLGLFGFSGEDVFKNIGILSGGEKARVSLSRILLSPQNLLIMDEPTNHLDSISRDAMEEALKSYEGSLLLVSHDRYFLDRIVTRVMELKDGKIYDFQGNYSSYLKNKDLKGDQYSDEVNIGSSAKSNKKDERKLRAISRQEISRERNRLRVIIEKLEKQISFLEEKRNEIEVKMADSDTYENSGTITVLQKEYASVKRELDHIFPQWEEAQLKIELLLKNIEKV